MFDSLHHPLSPEHGPDRGPRGGGGVRGGGAGARAARGLPPVGGQLGAETEGPRVLQEDHRALLRIQTRHVALQPRQGSTDAADVAFFFYYLVSARIMDPVY